MTHALSILHVCSIKGRGGTGYMAGRVARLLRDREHRVRIAACPGSKVEERAREADLPLLEGMELRRGFHPLSLWRDVERLRRAIREDAVDIVHTWHSIEYWTAALAVRGTKAKLARTRGLVTPIRPHLFNRWIHDRTAAVFVTCKKIEEIYRATGFRQDNVFVVNDGVDLEKFRPGGDRMTLRKELGLSEDTPLVVSVGRMQPVKGHLTFLEALAKFPDTVHGAIAGDGWQRPELEEARQRLGLEKRAHFLGVRDDIPAILAAADVFALCSIGSEGSSRGTLEAFACAVPVVTTTVGMLPDIVKPGRTGLLFPPYGVDQLAECIGNLLGDATMRRRLGEAARRWVEEHHTEDIMARQVEEAYYKIAEGDQA